MLVHVGLGVILKGRCADVRCTFNERKSVILHWLESFQKPRTDSALEYGHVVAIFGCRFELEPN